MLWCGVLRGLPVSRVDAIVDKETRVDRFPYILDMATLILLKEVRWRSLCNRISHGNAMHPLRQVRPNFPNCRCETFGWGGEMVGVGVSKQERRGAVPLYFVVPPTRHCD